MAKWKWSITQGLHSAETQENLTQDGSDAMNAEAQDKSEYILQMANEIIHGRRKDDYGKAERSFKTIAELWTTYLQSCRLGREYVTASDVAMMMILLKVARTDHVPTTDSLIDICGYAALNAECIDED